MARKTARRPWRTTELSSVPATTYLQVSDGFVVYNLVFDATVSADDAVAYVAEYNRPFESYFPTVSGSINNRADVAVKFDLKYSCVSDLVADLASVSGKEVRPVAYRDVSF
jgi:hypothetical protein